MPARERASAVLAVARDRARRALRLVAFAALAGVSCSAILGIDEVPDDGERGSDASDVAAQPPEADAGDERTSEEVGPVDDHAGPVCTDGLTRCGDHCASLGTSREDCGGCGHACGGGDCVSGACTPMALVRGIDAPSGFDVDEDGIYFASAGTVQSCPLTGCAGGPKQLAAPAGLTALAVVNGTIAFVADNPAWLNDHAFASAIFACPTSGCPAVLSKPMPRPRLSRGGYNQLLGFGDSLFDEETPIYSNAVDAIYRCASPSPEGCAGLRKIAQPAYFPWAVDAANVYFGGRQADTSTQVDEILACPNVDADCATASVVARDVTPTVMAAFASTLYFAGASRGEDDGRLHTCAVDHCGKPATFTAASFAVTAIVADASGVYFAASAAGDARVYACPLAGCTGSGPRAIATGQARPTAMRTDARFVYWVDLGAADAGADAASIVRVAK